MTDVIAAQGYEVAHELIDDLAIEQASAMH